ncbi:hypothetical protein [Spirillospora albida]|uniref:hypothetical protein n=1 Tax=Spirillospora albida TaxID=58123 RepID=UPI0006900B38|nr:hypothetical protein [Spirillospora albida]
MSIEDVFDLMSRSEELPYGEARTVLVEDALRRAEAAGEEELAFRIRVRLTDAYQYGGEPAKALATFGRTLADHDRDPARFDETHMLLWQMKAAVNSLTRFPEIPLDRAYAVLDDMERRYRAGGHSLQAVYHYRNVVARHVGDGSADEWFLKWRAAPRDELSDCAGCDPTGMVWHLVGTGRHEDAFEIAAPVLNAELGCNEQPQSVQTAMMHVYLRTGRAEQAVDAHRRAYRVHRTRLADLGDIAEHVWFCAVTGNAARGLEIVERHLGWLDRAPSPRDAMSFASAAALLLRRVAAAGHAGTIRRGTSGEVALDVLRAELTETATAIAARFDARNGTSHQGDKVRALLDAEPLTEFLPLAAHHRRPAAPAPAPEPPAAPDLPGDVDALLDLADRRRADDDMARVFAAWHRVDALSETVDLTPLQRARRIDGIGVESAVNGDAESAALRFAEAARMFGELGEDVRRHRVLSRLGAIRISLGDPEGLADLTAAADFLTARPPGDGAATAALMRLAAVHLEGGRPAEALAALDRVDPDDDPSGGGEAHAMRGHALLVTGDVPGAIAELRRALPLARAGGSPENLARTALMLSDALGAEVEEPTDEIVALLNEAVAALPASSGMRLGAHSRRGSVLLAANRPADAVADLVEAVAGWTAAGEHANAAFARVDLAAGYLSGGRALEAAEVAEEALPALADLGAADAERRCRLILGHAQKELGEEDAAGTFTALAEDAARDGEPAAVAHFLEEAGGILTDLDKDALAAERFGAAADAHEKAGNPYGVVDARRRAAMCHLWSGDPEAAAASMTAARESIDAIPAEAEDARTWYASLVAYDEARLLAQTGDPHEALKHATRAGEGFRAVNQEGPAADAEALRTQIAEDLEGRGENG